MREGRTPSMAIGQEPRLDSPRPERDAPVGPRAGLAYLARGLVTLRADWPSYLLITLVYAAPAALAASAAVAVAAPPTWLSLLIGGLPWLTAVLGTVAVMVAIGEGAHGRPIRLGAVSGAALRWTPRYLWTNAHTSLVFWLPMTALSAARGWQEAALPMGGAAGAAMALLWWLVIGGAALVIHTRTLLAPFLAIHGDLPGTLAALEAWRLSGHHFARCLAVLVAGSLPVALPLALATAGALVMTGDAGWRALANAGPALLWLAIQLVRPVLMPAVYALYVDLWTAERARRQRDGAPPLPRLARALLALTRPLPHPPAWGRQARTGE
jgi:hypothetical protein